MCHVPFTLNPGEADAGFVAKACAVLAEYGADATDGQ